MCTYRLSDEVCLESFGAEAILFIADWDRLLTIDRTATDLFERLKAELGTASFSRDDLTRLLSKRYQFDEAMAGEETKKLLAFALRQGIVHKMKVCGE
jgi:hypothetical protein